MPSSTPPTTRKIPSLLGLALDHLITANGWSARELAGKAGISPTTISAYIWEDALTRERLEELAVLMGLGPAAVERAILSARLVLPSSPTPWSPVDPTPEERRIAEKAAAMAVGELMEVILDVRLREVRQEKRRLGLEEGKRLSRELKTYSPADRRTLIEATPEYQHWGLAYVLCFESEAAAPHDPGKALELAELAVFVARHVGLEEPGSAGFRSRLEGWCTGFVGNAQRVLGSDLPGAEQTFDRVWSLWDAGDDPAGLLSKARLLDLEASLRGDLRLFPQALRLHDKALAAAHPREKGHLLLNKACTLQEMGEHEEAIQTLGQAAQHIDAERQPRLVFAVHFNKAANLLRLGRASEAVLLVDEARRMAERLRNSIDLVKTLWLEGNCAAGLGQKQEALAKLEQVRHAFARNLPFDYALASLDAALLYREEGRLAEIKMLAAEMLEIFKTQQVHREVIGAVILFQEAAEKEQVTTELVRRLQNDITRAQKNQWCR